MDEDEYFLIDNDDPGISSIYKEILEENPRVKSLSKTSTTSQENNKPSNGNVVYEEHQSRIHDRDDHFVLKNVHPILSNYQGNEDSFSRTTPKEYVKLVPLLHELPLDSSYFP